MSKIKEAIELLTKDVAFWDNFDGEVAELFRKDYNQVLAILLALLKEQPEPTSLGNTIRSIADSIKSETDRNIIYQAARRLDRWWAYIQELKAPEQPPAGEFTEKLRNFVKMYENEIPRRAEITFLEEACECLDRSEARLKAMYAGDLSPESRLNGYKVIVAELRSEVKLWKLRVDECAEIVESQETKIEQLKASWKELLEKADNFCKAWNNHASEVELHKAYFECEAAIKANKEISENESQI